MGSNQASTLALADPDLIIAAWDRRLHAGAATAGLRVAPAELPAPTRHHHQHGKRLTERPRASGGWPT